MHNYKHYKVHYFSKFNFLNDFSSYFEYKILFHFLDQNSVLYFNLRYMLDLVEKADK